MHVAPVKVNSGTCRISHWSVDGYGIRNLMR